MDRHAIASYAWGARLLGLLVLAAAPGCTTDLAGSLPAVGASTEQSPLPSPSDVGALDDTSPAASDDSPDDTSSGPSDDGSRDASAGTNDDASADMTLQGDAAEPDRCPGNPDKSEPGACGCDVLDTDTDADGVLNCEDACPADPEKVQPGLCGCGQSDQGALSAAECVDGCPEDPAKTGPGACGCGVADTDGDEDGVLDCEDACPDDSEKSELGVCGCGSSDEDSDGDGTSDCDDGCPDDPDKQAAGVCGCGSPETDADEDNVPDCVDDCVGELAGDAGNVTDAGNACGCGESNTDTDEDGSADCVDGCPNDANKTESGACGCGFADLDTDEDGALDCNDACPSDPEKTDPLACGCGEDETDSDSDGTPDCVDECPDNAGKSEPGACGCEHPDTLGDDTIADCLDLLGALVHRYSFGGSGATAPDRVGDANGTLVGTTLNGTGSANLSTGPYVDLPNDTLEGLVSVTFEVWLRRGSSTSTFQRVFDFGDSGTEGQTGRGVTYIYLTPQTTEDKGDAIRLTFFDGANEAILTGAEPLALNSPSHVAAVFDAAGDEMRLHVDGTMVAQRVWTFALDDINPINSWLGRSQFMADPGFDGSIDEFRIYDAALDGDQIQYSIDAGTDPEFLQ